MLADVVVPLPSSPESFKPMRTRHAQVSWRQNGRKSPNQRPRQTHERRQHDQRAPETSVYDSVRIKHDSLLSGSLCR